MENYDCLKIWIEAISAFFTILLSLFLWISTRRIGNRQNELQENQNKTELNKIYLSLYNCLSNIKSICDNFFYHIEVGISSIVDEKENLAYKLYITEFNSIQKEYKDNRIYIKLYLNDYPKLVDNIDALLFHIQTVYSSINSLQMSNYMTDGNYERMRMTEKMIQSVGKSLPGYFLTEITDISTISEKDYRDLLYRVRNIMLETSWTLDKFKTNSDKDNINHIKDCFSMFTENINIEQYCIQFIKLKDKVFDNNLLNNIEQIFKIKKTKKRRWFRRH